jgi:hypothetical protein
VETAGLRRFGYPVHTVLPAPPGATFRLLRDGRAIPAQFCSVVGERGEPAVALDFNVSLGPLDTVDYQVAFGEDVPAGPDPGRGLHVDQAGRVYRISGTGVTYEVPDDLVGFLSRVGNDGKEFVRQGSPGFWIHSAAQPEGRDDRPAPPLHGTVRRQGPLAVSLRFEGRWPTGDDQSIPAVVDLTVPSSKSWVEIAWTLDDRQAGRVQEFGLDLDLAVDGVPTLVDLGAGGTVYGTIRGGERIGLADGPREDWQIHTIAGDRTTQQATGRRSQGAAGGQPAEGWAHVMDATRCTAVALAEFGRQARDRIEIAANGRVRLSRRYDAGRPSLKTLRAWFHFVGMPVQVGAVTSPQSMLAPLKVEHLGAAPSRPS